MTRGGSERLNSLGSPWMVGGQKCHSLEGVFNMICAMKFYLKCVKNGMHKETLVSLVWSKGFSSVSLKIPTWCRGKEHQHYIPSGPFTLLGH